MEAEGCLLSERIIQEFVAFQVALEPPDIQTVHVLQPIESRELDREPYLTALVLCLVAINRNLTIR